MIVGYELHIKTTKSIGEIMDYLKTKGFMVDLELCKDEDHCELEVKHPQKPKSHEFKVKLYDEMGDMKHYEIYSHDKEQFTLSEDWFKEV